MTKRYSVTLRLTKEQARALWGIIDGAQDAGACADGLTPVENSACTIAATALLKVVTKKET